MLKELMALSWSKRVRLAAAWCVGAYLANMFIRMGWVKFDPEGFWTAAFERWGYPPWLRISVGVIEVAGGAMLVLPWFATIGGVAVAWVMAAAWLTRLLDHRYVDVAWITVYGSASLWIALEWWEFRFWKRRHWIAPILLAASCVAAPVLAHPGSGIVVDRRGEVYFLDTGAGLWKIDAKGALVRVDGPRFHWLTLDADDRFKHVQLPSGATGEVVRAGSAPTLLLASDYPLAIGRDGNLYYARRASGGRSDLVRLLPSGESSTLTTLPFPYLNGMTAAPDGFLYFTEHKNIRKISAQGQVTMVAANIAPSGCASIPGTEANDSLRGLAVDAAGTVYVAASACGSVLKIAPDGKITKLLQTESPWSPTAVALAGADLYVLEYLHTATEDRRAWLPRVRKISADGKTAVIATVSRP